MTGPAQGTLCPWSRIAPYSVSCLFWASASLPRLATQRRNQSLSAPLLVLLLARYIVQGLLPLPLIIVTGRQLRMSPRVVRVIITRSMVNIAGSAAMYAALRYLPLADALAIAFVYPFIMLLMGWTLLKEQVGIRRLLACSVGFIGTLLIIQPSFAAVGLPALLPLLVAFLFASVVLLTRQIAKDYDPVSLQSVSGLTSGLILMVIWALAGGANIPDLQFTVPTTDQMITLLMVGVLGTLAHLAMSYAVDSRHQRHGVDAVCRTSRRDRNRLGNVW